MIMTGKSGKRNIGSGSNSGTHQRQVGPPPSYRSGVFIGDVPELNQNCYYCSNFKQADQYVTTTKAIKSYVGHNYSKYPRY